MSFPKDDMTTKLLVSLVYKSDLEVLIKKGHDPRLELSGLNLYLCSSEHSKVLIFLQVTRYPSRCFQYVSIINFHFFP